MYLTLIFVLPYGFAITTIKMMRINQINTTNEHVYSKNVYWCANTLSKDTLKTVKSYFFFNLLFRN